MKYIFSMATILFLGMALSGFTQDPQTYKVVKIKNNSMVLCDKGVNPLWNRAIPLTDFCYPWSDETPPKTCFKALWDGDHFYFLFDVEDDNIIIKKENRPQLDIDQSDRVELFFRHNKNMNPYYGLEVDPSKRILDYEASYPRNFNFDWTWPDSSITIYTKQTETGYIVKGSISIKLLNELGLVNNNKIEAGIFRANAVEVSGSESSVKWISWIDPHTEKPDFHIPSTFGILLLSEY